MFSIEELEEMKSFTVLDFVYKIDKVMNRLQPFAEKVLEGKRGSARQARTHFAEIKFLCTVARDKLIIDQGGKIITNHIQNKIDIQKEKLARAKEKFEKRKEEIRKQQENGKKE